MAIQDPHVFLFKALLNNFGQTYGIDRRLNKKQTQLSSDDNVCILYEYVVTVSTTAIYIYKRFPKLKLIATFSYSKGAVWFTLPTTVKLNNKLYLKKSIVVNNHHELVDYLNLVLGSVITYDHGKWVYQDDFNHWDIIYR